MIRLSNHSVLLLDLPFFSFFIVFSFPLLASLLFYFPFFVTLSFFPFPLHTSLFFFCSFWGMEKFFHKILFRLCSSHYFYLHLNPFSLFFFPIFLLFFFFLSTFFSPNTFFFFFSSPILFSYLIFSFPSCILLTFPPPYVPFSSSSSFAVSISLSSLTNLILHILIKLYFSLLQEMSCSINISSKIMIDYRNM